MSLHYFIDGYNLLHSTDRWDRFPREQRRLCLIKFLEERRPTGSERNRVTIVFDGHGPSLGTIRAPFVQILFSGDKDADTVIKERVQEMPNARNAIVVTNDRGIQYVIKRGGAKFLSCEEFLKMGQTNQPREVIEEVDSQTTESINAELKKLWKMK